MAYFCKASYSVQCDHSCLPLLSEGRQYGIWDTNHVSAAFIVGVVLM